MIDLEFIKRAQDIMKDDVLKAVKKTTQYNKKSVKKFYKTEIGRVAQDLKCLALFLFS
jgi:hypothetical protein